MHRTSKTFLFSECLLFYTDQENHSYKCDKYSAWIRFKTASEVNFLHQTEFSQITYQVDRHPVRETAPVRVRIRQSQFKVAAGIRAHSDWYVRFTIEVKSCIFGWVSWAVGWVAGHDGRVLVVVVVEEHMWRKHHVPRTAIRISSGGSRRGGGGANISPVA